MAKHRRSKGEGSIYPVVKNGRTWHVAQVVRGRYANGRLKYARRWRPTRGAAVQALNELRNNDTTVDPNRTVKDFMEWWLTNVKYTTLKAESSKANYRARVAQIVRCIGHIKLANLESHHIDTMITRLQADGLQGHYVSAIRKALANALDYAVMQKWATVNVVRLKHGRVSEPKPLKDAYTADQSHALIARTADHIWGNLVELALKLGFREGELIHCELRHVDLDGDDGSTLTVWDGKTEASIRTVPLMFGTTDVVRRQLELREKMRANGTVWYDTPYLFVSAYGKRIQPGTLRKWWSDVNVAVIGEHRRFHATRVTAATIMAEMGVPDSIIQHILGHARLETTANVYIKTTRDRVRRKLKEYDQEWGKRKDGK